MTKLKTDIIAEAERWVAELLQNDSTGHDMSHIDRVRRAARRIAQEEGADLFLVDMMALFHELPDEKLNLFESPEQAYRKMREWLEARELAEGVIQEIEAVVSRQSYAHSGVNRERLDSLAGKIVQDADRLEALGAIGAARCFAYGGKKGRPLYDAAIPFRNNVTEDNYRNSPSSLHHFTEKLFRIKEKMNTATGKRLAEARHEFTKQFFDQFLAEWKGEG